MAGHVALRRRDRAGSGLGEQPVLDRELGVLLGAGVEAYVQTTDCSARSTALAVAPQLDRYENCHHHSASTVRPAL